MLKEFFCRKIASFIFTTRFHCVRKVMNCFRFKGLRSRTTICQFFYHPFTEKVQVISSISE